jgi:hypothetical protein
MVGGAPVSYVAPESVDEVLSSSGPLIPTAHEEPARSSAMAMRR